MTANEKQIGGTHYKSSLQHWDLALMHSGTAYHINCATKYLSRYKKKGFALQDLEKALHYTEKVIEAELGLASGYIPDSTIYRFCEVNELGDDVYRILRILWQSADVSPAKPLLERLIEVVKTELNNLKIEPKRSEIAP